MSAAKKNPIADIALEPYWEAARDGRLLLKRCESCGKTHYYPRPLCPFCMSDETTWVEAAGTGTVYSWSVQRRAEPPYAIAFVTLSEGLLRNNMDPAEYKHVVLGLLFLKYIEDAFEERDGQPTPVFRPA